MDTIDIRSIGKNIQELRHSMNMTQEEFADFLNYSSRQIRRIEEEGTGSISVINYIAKMGEVSPLSLLGLPC